MCDLVTTAQKLGVHLASKPTDPCGASSGDGITMDDEDRSAATTLVSHVADPGGEIHLPTDDGGGLRGLLRDGKFCEPRPVITITDHTGKNLPVPDEKCSQALDADVAHGIVYALKKVLTQGTAADRGIGVPAGAKTGTSDGSGNTWFVGYTRSLSTAVWVADPSTYPRDYPAPLGEQSAPCRTSRSTGSGTACVFGSTIAGAIWHDFMDKAINGRNNSDWEDPPISMLKGSGIRLPNVIGQPFDQATATLKLPGTR